MRTELAALKAMMDLTRPGCAPTQAPPHIPNRGLAGRGLPIPVKGYRKNTIHNRLDSFLCVSLLLLVYCIANPKPVDVNKNISPGLCSPKITSAIANPPASPGYPPHRTLPIFSSSFTNETSTGPPQSKTKITGLFATLATLVVAATAAEAEAEMFPLQRLITTHTLLFTILSSKNSCPNQNYHFVTSRQISHPDPVFPKRLLRLVRELFSPLCERPDRTPPLLLAFSRPSGLNSAANDSSSPSSLTAMRLFFINPSPSVTTMQHHQRSSNSPNHHDDPHQSLMGPATLLHHHHHHHHDQSQQLEMRKAEELRSDRSQFGSAATSLLFYHNQQQQKQQLHMTSIQQPSQRNCHRRSKNMGLVAYTLGLRHAEGNAPDAVGHFGL
ncbi:hypothetical protein M5K25_023069 [Dendrobium thyrsiflorum]|uniref:Uncharacterized protein n=1 Tax=Dendrobium thyrsiflorum TaxID=117978 RepID=A0ABD0U797_DENTH